MALSRWQKKIEHYWYSRPGPLWLLFPLEYLFSVVAQKKRKQSLAQQCDLNVPVLVIGNISVGGTGKTPALINLLTFLLASGLKPGVVSRGYGRDTDKPCIVNETSLSAEVGEEPLLIWQQSACPVSVHSDRHFAAEVLLKEHPECDLILADDGLQHYKLKRDLELALIDAERLFGNGHLLPLGPLREKPERLNTVNWVVVNHRKAKGIDPEASLAQHATLEKVLVDKSKISHAQLQAKGLRHIHSGAVLEVDEFAKALSTHTLIALAAIANPQAFFESLADISQNIERFSFPDHYHWRTDELQAFSGRFLICTSKDAVKIRERIVRAPQLDASRWYALQVELELDLPLKNAIYAALIQLKSRGEQQ